MMLLCVAMGPVRTGVHLVRRGRMALILSHLVSLRLVGGVGRRVCGAVRRERGIYHGVRLDIGRWASLECGQEQTWCLSHAGRSTTRLRAGRVGLWARKVLLVGGRASRWRVQPVLWLGSIGGAHLGLRCVLDVGWGVMSRGSSSRSLVCGLFRRGVGGGRMVVRTWLCVLGSWPVHKKLCSSRARRRDKSTPNASVTVSLESMIGVWRIKSRDPRLARHVEIVADRHSKGANVGKFDIHFLRGRCRSWICGDKKERGSTRFCQSAFNEAPMLKF